MPDYPHVAVRFIRHWLLCEGIHSAQTPHLFRFCSEVLYAKPRFLPEAEKLRHSLVCNQQIVPGFSHAGHFRKARSVASIIRMEVASATLASFYNRLIHFSGATRVLEIGTSVGITSLYLSADPNVQLVTVESVDEIASIARSNFQSAERRNIQMITGDAVKKLNGIFEDGFIPDLVLIDASHHLTATLAFFKTVAAHMNPNGIIVIDDIHHNSGMTAAWKNITGSERASLTVDCFRFGIVFLDQSLQRENRIFETPASLIFT